MRRLLTTFALGVGFVCAQATPNNTSAQSTAPAKAPALNDALVLLHQGKNQEAIEQFKKAAKQSHNCSDCDLGIAIASLSIGKNDDVIKFAQRVLKNDNPPAGQAAYAHHLIGMILLTRARSNHDKKKITQAQNEFQSALALTPTDTIDHLELGVTLLQLGDTQRGLAELNTFLTSSPTGDNADYARRLVENPRLAGLNLAPLFTLTAVDGRSVSLKQLLGHPVLIDFWASWCGPCQMSQPSLHRIEQKFAKDGLIVVSIDGAEDEAAWRAAAQRDRGTSLQCYDQGGAVGTNYGVEGFPTFLFIDDIGAIRDRQSGWSPAFEMWMTETAGKLLKEAKKRQAPGK